MKYARVKTPRGYRILEVRVDDADMLVGYLLDSDGTHKLMLSQGHQRLSIQVVRPSEVLARGSTFEEVRLP